MKRIILFRFHERAEVCRNRLDLLKRHNPEAAIYGLYGGNESSYPKVEYRSCVTTKCSFHSLRRISGLVYTTPIFAADGSTRGRTASLTVATKK
jgi:hypothetical protein